MPGGYCCVVNCSNKNGHSFPKDEKRREQWRIAVRRDKWKPTNASIVCYEHFLPSDYNPADYTYEGTIRERQRLKKTAVPSVFELTKAKTSVQTERNKRIQKRNKAERIRVAAERKAAANEKESHITIFGEADLLKFFVVAEEVVYSTVADSGTLTLEAGVDESVRADIRDVNSPNWKPTLHLGHNIPECIRKTPQKCDDDDVPPVIDNDCLWPTVDHIYCTPYLDKDRKKPLAVEAKAGGRSRYKKVLDCTTVEYEGSTRETETETACETKTQTVRETKTQTARESKTQIARESKTQIARESKTQIARESKTETSREESRKCPKKPALRINISGGERVEKCCVAGCRAGGRRSKKSLFPFPVRKARCSEWLRYVGREDLLEKRPHQLRSEGYKVCSDHFEPNHLLQAGERVRLARNAVPTLNKSGRSQSQKKKAVAEESRQLGVKQKKSKRQGRTEGRPEAAVLPEIKVEIDWAEDSILHSSRQELSLSGTLEEHADVGRSSAGEVAESPSLSRAVQMNTCLELAGEDVKEDGTGHQVNPQTLHYLQSASSEGKMSVPGVGHTEMGVHYLQSAASEGKEMSVPGVGHTEMGVSSSSQAEMVGHIKSEPVEEGGEERFLSGSGEPWMESAWYTRTVGYMESDCVRGNKSLGCVGDERVPTCIKFEPGDDHITTSSWSANSDPVSKFEPVNCSERNYDSSSKHMNCDHVNSEHMNCDRVKIEHINCDHVNSKHMNCDYVNSEHRDCDRCNHEHINCDHVGDRQTSTADVIEEDDWDMSYTVVKAEPQSDSDTEDDRR